MEVENSLFRETERNPFRMAEKGDREFQYLSSYNGAFLIQFGDSFLNPTTVILFHKGQGKQVCVGLLEGKSFNADPLFNDAISVMIDRKIEETISLQINSGNNNFKHSIDHNSSKTEDLLLIFIENNFHAKLILFDGSLEEKLVEKDAYNEKYRNLLRYYAMSYVTNIFPELFSSGGLQSDKDQRKYDN
ncbi:hypothetical protein IEC97_14685 [Neobacillus cucumis]|uniref:hypothetical protein n=1 Tax=Neobacillus cucumis TaxID=1740721 RepID=UPI0018E02273|nr:hypothetical protein [Neobacillus cucumis]MBI0578610.1 hypothetical protein [Neobacillus cucumis]